ncbi:MULTISPECIES: hypothetical protein [unclassified Bradyrhizobium]|uniref:hypothetical protein n=1 Tax=unclassified Bradyrhizobium TaxID=2631580 RepID=UPI0028EEF24D|nr:MULTISPECIES: hypothetical protein [unclassified Bradyrhizobium]
MRLNKGGLIVSAVYIVHFLVFICFSYFAGLKASVLLAEFAVLPAGLILGSIWPLLGLHDPPFDADSWMNSYVFYFPVSLFISYMVGWALHAFWRLLARYVAPRLDRLDERLVRRFHRD